MNLLTIAEVAVRLALAPKNFGNHPEPVTHTGAVGAQDAEAVLQTELISADVFGGFSPVAGYVSS